MDRPRQFSDADPSPPQGIYFLKFGFPLLIPERGKSSRFLPDGLDPHLFLFIGRLLFTEWEGGGGGCCCLKDVTDDFPGESDDELRFDGDDGNAGFLALPRLPRA